MTVNLKESEMETVQKALSLMVSLLTEQSDPERHTPALCMAAAMTLETTTDLKVRLETEWANQAPDEMIVRLRDFEVKVARIALTDYALNLREYSDDGGPEEVFNAMDEASRLVMDMANRLNERLEQALIDAKEMQQARCTIREVVQV